MNGKKLYEVETKETVTRVYAVLAEDESEASIEFGNGEIVDEYNYSDQVLHIEEVE